MDKKRIKSYILIILIYVFASVCGIAFFAFLSSDKFNLKIDIFSKEYFWLSLLFADVLATIIVFIFSVILKNASVYDPYWSVQPIVILVGFAFLQKKLSILSILLLVVVSIWGVRLTVNWAYTFKGISHQDWRYTMLKEKTGKLYPLVNFLGIHTFPTLVVYACVLPAAFASFYDIKFNPISIVFICVSLLAVVLQGTADIQMHSFRKSRTSNFIQKGLWKYSRHPNYLGEILMWWGVGLAVVVCEPKLWYLLSGALINTLMFLLISIPLADGRQSKKEGFIEYKKQTRMLLPIKKK